MSQIRDMQVLQSNLLSPSFWQWRKPKGSIWGKIVVQATVYENE